MSKRERKSYDRAFQLMAVELYNSGKPDSTITKDLGIGVDMVRRWAKEHEIANQEVKKIILNNQE